MEATVRKERIIFYDLENAINALPPMAFIELAGYGILLLVVFDDCDEAKESSIV